MTPSSYLLYQISIWFIPVVVAVTFDRLRSPLRSSSFRIGTDAADSFLDGLEHTVERERSGRRIVARVEDNN
jgi:hypothetical protein